MEKNIIIPGHTVDPMLVVRVQHATKVERARRMVEEGRLRDADLLVRRCERLSKRDTAAHYEEQLTLALA